MLSLEEMREVDIVSRETWNTVKVPVEKDLDDESRYSKESRSADFDVSHEAIDDNICKL